MTGGGGSDQPPPQQPFLSPQQPPSTTTDGGEFLLRLVQNHHRQQQPPHHLHQSQSSPHNLSLDPAVAAIGPSRPIPLPTNPHHQSNFSLSPQKPNFFFQGFPHNTPPWPHQQHQSPPISHQTPSFFSAPHQHFDLFRHQQQQQQHDKGLFGNVPFPNSTNINANTSGLDQETLKLKLKLEREIELLKERELGLGFRARTVNGFDPNRGIDPRVNWVHGSPDQRRGSGPPPGFAGSPSNQRNISGSTSSEFNNHRGFSSSSSSSSKDHEREKRFSSRDNNGGGLSGQLDHPGLPSGSALRSVSRTDTEESLKQNVNGQMGDNGVSIDEVDDLSEQLVHSVLGEDESDDKTETGAKKKHHRDKDFRSDARGKWILSQRMRNSRRLIECRRDIHRLNAPLLTIYESLIPVEEEKAKQKQLLTLLEKLVRKEWPNARLFVYGSCANSFGVSKSDIDICLAINDQDINKSEVLLKLADILQSDNLQNVQALTRARVPIVKLMDPVTGYSCDICINNVLAVVNTKLLRDYAEIDVRLRQLAFLVKHWAKSRGVNETYQGTLSSYAYVLMCIHFLQQRNPPILPCLQLQEYAIELDLHRGLPQNKTFQRNEVLEKGMEATYAVTVDDIKCAYFDQVEKLGDFGTRNKESIAQLVWGFFNYWAYCHDYANSVISIRTGIILSKHEKDWTRRIGNDRHLICIEDPFEVSHDLGRVVDKHSIRVLREEFERAAEILQYDPNPCVALFEPYLPS